MREWKMNMNFAQTKSKVNPTNQTVLTCVLCLLSTISLILFLLRGEYGLDINTAFLTERFVVYASLPILVFIPFVRIGKTIKIIPAIIGLSLGSMTFVFVIFPVMLILPGFVSAMSLIFVGYYINKWSKHWNQRFVK